MKNKYWVWLFVVATTFAVGGLTGFYIVRQYYSDLDSRLLMLEIQNTANLKSGQEIKMEEVKVWIAKSEENTKKEYDIFLKFGLPLTISALLTSIFGAYRWAAEIAKEKAEEAFKDPETLLKENKKILVLTPNGQSVEFLYSFFQIMKFQTPKYVSYNKPEDLDSLKSQYFDLIVLNVPDDVSGMDSQENTNIAHLTMGKSVFYFGPGKAKNPQLESTGKLSFANAKSQLYGNLINALKFQKML
jgi:hypothetical protein